MQILCNEEWRQERIKKALRIALAICGLSHDQAEKLIVSISDRKGCLVITWVTEPTTAQRNAFSVAWAECKEPAENITHTVTD